MLKKFWVGAMLLLVMALFSLPVYAYPDFSLSLLPDSLSVCPCTTIGSFTDKGSDIGLTLRNEGDIADTYELYLKLPGAEWSGFIYNARREITLGPDEEKRIEPVWITAGCTVKPGSYTVTIGAKSKTYGDIKEKQLGIEILRCHQVDLELQKSGETCRGIPIELELRITNYGKYEERFSLDASVNWARFPSDTVSIKSGEVKSINMTLEPPMDMTGIKNIGVSVKSLQSYAEDSETINLDIRDCYSFDASLEPASQPVCRGKAANYLLSITNTGSKYDTYSVYAPGWIIPDSGNVTIAPGGSRDVILSATAAWTGMFHFNITVISSEYPLYPELKKVIGGVADVKECRGVAVVLSPASQEICSADGTEYQVTVKNIGTATDTFTLENTLGKLEDDKLVLEAGESRTIKLTIGPGSLSPGNKMVRVNASSDGVYDGDEADLLVENCYSAEITIEPDSASVCPCFSSEFRAKVENSGKLADNYTFSFTTPNNMSKADFEKTLRLLPGESGTFELSIPIPCDAKAGSYKIMARAESEHIQEVGEATLAVKEMGECYSLNLSAEKESLETIRGKAAVFAINAENTGEVKDTFRLILIGPEWSYLSTGEVTLEPGESQIVFIYASPAYGSELKEYGMKVTAASGHSTSELALRVVVAEELAAGEEPRPPGNATPAGNETQNVTGNVSVNVSIGGTGQIIGETVAISWKIIAVTIISLAIIVILITRFVVLIR